MLDPFKDFGTRGYLRNNAATGDPNEVRQLEHEAFLANVADAQKALAKSEAITYEDFLKVHRRLFSDFYPWAGKDRLAIAPEVGIIKGATRFCDPADCRRAVDAGLHLAQRPGMMLKKPGEVMGLFAFGHPFLDGNGRTMMVVHAELCQRAGFSIDWSLSRKNDYLEHLSREIVTPGIGILDEYLKRFIAAALPGAEWAMQLSGMPGLDGVTDDNETFDVTDPAARREYEALKARRAYKMES